MNDTIIKIDNVKKQYRLGLIGGGTLQGDLQSWWARVRGKEDPNSKIGAKTYKKNERFLALDGINLEVKKGERVGIIGHNGAGKSTLLKLLSRVTAPTEGEIYLDGRISSMLEVGTGFHGELTGRENIYLNGAILGMTREEVTAKIDKIIEFSECGQFIDTPVKRYSSGMYVKLAFSVAAHLDSEIMIMDEVLAVGDVAFQQKCLNKMRDTSTEEGRTVLYVSHNMNTIRQLCDRCIVLNKGKIVFDGDVEEAIDIYIQKGAEYENSVDLTGVKRAPEFSNNDFNMIYFSALDNDTNVYDVGSNIKGVISYEAKKDFDDVNFRVVLKTASGEPVTMALGERAISVDKTQKGKIKFDLDISSIAPGKYAISPVFYILNEFGSQQHLDGIHDLYRFEVVNDNTFNNNMKWDGRYWGYMYSKPVKIDVMKETS